MIPKGSMLVDGLNIKETHLSKKINFRYDALLPLKKPALHISYMRRHVFFNLRLASFRKFNFG